MDEDVKAFVPFSPSLPAALQSLPAPQFEEGRLTSVGNANSATYWAKLDPLGRVLEQTQYTGGVVYELDYSYNPDGTLKTQRYPGTAPGQPGNQRRVVAFHYDGAGRPDGAGLNSVGATDYLQAASYAPHGAPSSMTLGNGLVETTNYNVRLQPTAIQAGSLLTLGFGYGTTNNNGNVLSQTIARPGLSTITEHYRYDPLNRLAVAAEGAVPTVGADPEAPDACPGGAVWCRDYLIDPRGNRSRAGTATTFDVANRIVGGGYDNAGNLTALTNVAASMLYDANNKMTFFDGPNAGIQEEGDYYYDGDGNRVARETRIAGTTTTTTYVYDAFGKLAAEYSNQAPSQAGRFFRTTDHLGSTRLVTTAGPTIAPGGCRDFYPFGQRIDDTVGGRAALSCYGAADAAFNQQFTAKERDDESGLDYFGARYFGASLGRFTSPDAPFANHRRFKIHRAGTSTPIGSNNPLLYVDPDGLRLADRRQQSQPDRGAQTRGNIAISATVADRTGRTWSSNAPAIRRCRLPRYPHEATGTPAWQGSYVRTASSTHVTGRTSRSFDSCGARMPHPSVIRCHGGIEEHNNGES